MNKYVMLDEHLNDIYLNEDLTTAINRLKSKSDDIVDAAKSGNILRLNKVLEKTPDVSLDSLYKVSKKKFPKQFKNSEKKIESKLKNAPDMLKKILIVARTSMDHINENTKDPELKEKIKDFIEKFDDFLLKISPKIIQYGLDVYIGALIIQLVIGPIPILLTIKLGASVIVALIVKKFIMAKKAGKKVIT